MEETKGEKGGTGSFAALDAMAECDRDRQRAALIHDLPTGAGTAEDGGGRRPCRVRSLIHIERRSKNVVDF